MNWSWMTHAYKNELRIVGWGKGIIFPKEQFAPKKLTHNALKAMVNPRIDSYKRFLERKNLEDSDDELEEDLTGLVHIVSWTKGTSLTSCKIMCFILIIYFISDY